MVAYDSTWWVQDGYSGCHLSTSLLLAAVKGGDLDPKFEDLQLSSSTPLTDLAEEARRIVSAAEQLNLALRLTGGVAVLLRCPSARHPALQRTYDDLDFVGLSSQNREIQWLFRHLGYTPDVSFNALHSRERLLFYNIQNSRRVDIMFDRFRMCHTIDMRMRVSLESQTLPLADLLLCKLQIVHLNEKDVGDIVALLLDHPLGQAEEGAIDLPYISGRLASDWGFYRTVQINLGKVESALLELGLSEAEEEKVHRQVELLWQSVETHPKTSGWKLRARIGDRVKWYELPEEIAHRELKEDEGEVQT